MSGANLARMEKPARSSWSEMNLLVRKTPDGESGETYKTPWLTCHFSEEGHDVKKLEALKEDLKVVLGRDPEGVIFEKIRT